MQLQRIFYYCPDISVPSGGVRSIYHHVETLCQAGFEAYVLHTDPAFRVTWFESTAPTRYLTPGIPITGRDVLVIPEGWPGIMKQTADASFARVVFAQGWSTIFSTLKPGANWRTFGISHVISVGRYTHDFIVETMGLESVIVEPCIDTNVFHCPAHIQKELQVAYMPRKNKQDARQIEGIFASRYALDPSPPFVPIDNLSQPEVARVLQQSAIFLATGYPEGLGLPGLEAMACGAVVVGFSGGGGMDYMQPGVNCLVTADGNVLEAAALLHQAVERHLAGDLDELRQTAQQAVLPYRPAMFHAKLLSFWSHFLECLNQPADRRNTVEWLGAGRLAHTQGSSL